LKLISLITHIYKEMVTNTFCSRKTEMVFSGKTTAIIFVLFTTTNKKHFWQCSYWMAIGQKRMLRKSYV